MPIDISKVSQKITQLKQYWYQRNLKFQSWYEFLILTDQLASKGMETYVSNEPQTFYNMAHYLLTKGEISHSTPIQNESALELDRRAKISRGCEYMWGTIDRERQLAGGQPFIDELSFFLLVLGWYSVVSMYDKSDGLLKTQIWNPYDTYPEYSNNKMSACVHSYRISEDEAVSKAADKGWTYQKIGVPMGEVNLDDFFYLEGNAYQNIVLINGRDVTGAVDRPEMQLLVAPVGGFPDKGSLLKYNSGSNSTVNSLRDWRRLTGRGIFEVNETVARAFNKWKSMISQILRDTAQPITEEFSATAQATVEQLRSRGAHFHYAPGEGGLQRVPPPVIPIEIQANLLELRREMQKGSFNDAVYGMMEGQPGYALSLLASSSANQILYPYMNGKHFVIAENDRFWLSNLKKEDKTFQVKGKFTEELTPKEIPDGVSIKVESQVATAKDWLERGTIGNMLDKHLDEATIISEIYGMSDPEAIKRRKGLDRMINHPMSQTLELLSAWESHADYLDMRGDKRQAARFRRAAKALEMQLTAPPAGAPKPAGTPQTVQDIEQGASEEQSRVKSQVAPPEARGFAPEQLRRSLGRGKVRTV